MKKLYLPLIYALMSIGTCFGHSRPDLPSVTGTYVLNLKHGAGGTLKVLQKGRHTIQFEIECGRGAPSYNSGIASGVIDLRNNLGIYVTTEYGGRCELKFEFHGSRVLVTQSGTSGDCGFGYGVICEGTYVRKSKKAPKFEKP